MTESAKDLLRTPLHALHLEYGAKMVDFAHYDMPIQYPLGVKNEHLHTRKLAGLFDVSHMGQLLVEGEQAAQWLETLIPIDIVDLPVGKQRYGLLTNEKGGVIDDLMVSRFSQNQFYLVINASRQAEDIEHLNKHLWPDVQITPLKTRALVALQGPTAAKALEKIVPEVASMVFMDCNIVHISGFECFVSRAGYTGEDGFEISAEAEFIDILCRKLLENTDVQLIGLGARDSLRLESGLCLYGHDMDETITPIEASLIWAISKVRRLEGSRAGGFLGSDIILEQIQNKTIERKRIGLIGDSKAPVREGTILMDEHQSVIGKVSSGGFSPTLNQPIAMGYVNIENSQLNNTVFAHVRGKSLPMTVSKMPFITQNYFRG